MKIFKFKFPGWRKDQIEDLPIKFKGQPIGTVLEVQETDEGLVVTGQFFEEVAEDPAFKKLFFNTDDLMALSLGPVSPMDDLVSYSKADAELTMALYQGRREAGDYDDQHGWIKPGTRMGCLTVILASIGFWILAYFAIHWMVTGQAFPIFDW